MTHHTFPLRTAAVVASLFLLTSLPLIVRATPSPQRSVASAMATRSSSVNTSFSWRGSTPPSCPRNSALPLVTMCARSLEVRK